MPTQTERTSTRGSTLGGQKNNGPRLVTEGLTIPPTVKELSAMAVSKRTRFEVLRRDGHICQYCGEKAPDVTLHVDHVVPVSLGGSDKPDNLVAACKDCNVGKASIQPDAPFVKAVGDRAADYALRAKSAATLIRAEYLAFEDFACEFEEKWNSYTLSSTGDELPMDRLWRKSIMQWWKSGVPEEAFWDAVDAAMAKSGVEPKDRFRYFAGIMWRRMDEYELMVDVRGIDDPLVYTEEELSEKIPDAYMEGRKAGYEEGYYQSFLDGTAAFRKRDRVRCFIDGNPVMNMRSEVVITNGA